MAETAINIRITLTDNVTKGLKNITTGINGFAEQYLKLGMQLRQTGRQISYLGMTMTMLGGAITAPFILALKQAKDHSVNVSRAMFDLENTFTNLQVKIAEGILPVVKKMIDIFSNLVDKFNALDPATREHILQVVFMTGVYLTLTGIIVTIIGKIVAFIGVLDILISKFVLLLTVHPILLAIYISIGLIVTAMWKWKDVSDIVMSTFQGMATLLNTVFSGVLAVIETLVGSIAKIFAFLLGILEKAGRLVGSELTSNFKAWREELDKFSTNTFSKSIANFDTSVKEFNKTIDIARGKNTEWADAFNKFKGKTIDTIDTLKKLGALLQGLSLGKGKSAEPQGFFGGFALGLEQARQNLMKWADTGKLVATNLVTSMGDSFTTFFDDIFAGSLKKGQEYFAEFGRAILKQFSQVLSQMAVNWVMFGNIFGGKTDKLGGIMGTISGIASLFGGGGTATIAGMGKVNVAPANYYLGAGAMHTGGLIKAHSGLAIDEVPIIAQTGERILSRRQNAQYEKGTRDGDTYQPVVIIQAWDTQDIMRNRKSIEAIIANALRTNSSLRGDIKKYG